MIQVTIRNTIFAASYLCISLVAQAATFGELADYQPMPPQGQQVTPMPAPPTAVQPRAVRGPVYQGDFYIRPRARDRGQMAPNQSLLDWSHGQQRRFDDPNTWDVLDNRFLWAPWGNPLAPYTSTTINDWWRNRGWESRPYSYADDWR